MPQKAKKALRSFVRNTCEQIAKDRTERGFLYK